jgi:hypothetical protein
MPDDQDDATALDDTAVLEEETSEKELPEGETEGEAQEEETPDEDVDSLKEQLRKAQEERDNYKQGLLAAKKKQKFREPEAPAPVTLPSEEGFVSKKDFFKQNEKKGISKAIASHPEIGENWEEIIQHYAGRRGKYTPDDVIEDIEDAFILWKARKPQVDNTQKRASAKASTISAEPSSSPTRSEDTSALTKEQRLVARKMGLTDAEYARNL